MDPVPEQVTSDIREEYTRRRDNRRKTFERWSWIEGRVADARLVVFVAGLIVAYLIYRETSIGTGWFMAIGLVFLGLLLVHDPIRRFSRGSGRARDFYARGLDRLEGNWAGRGVTGSEFFHESHPYAADLDLFGTGSLFERLCTARTRSGEETLAAWLLKPATPETIRERHAAIDELRPRFDLREDIELLGQDVRAGIDPAALIAWGRLPREFPGPTPRIIAFILGSFAIGSLLAWFVFGQSILWLLGSSILVAGFTLAFLRKTSRILEAIDQRTHDLQILAGLLERIERESFTSPALQRIKEKLSTHGYPASHQIQRLARRLQLLDARRNQIFLPFALLMLWTEQIAMSIDAWRAESGQAIADWLAAVGEFEGLCALAVYAAENPDNPFPEIVDGSEPACYSAEALGHPLIPLASCVRNDVALGTPGAPRAMVVTGSNMSGKSTMLRTIGVNAVLALCGAPVRAERLKLTPLAIGATLRVQDSLQSGKSRFFAEITRVRQVVEISRGPIPLLFLLDEIFHGTNSADRRIGAGAIVRGLLDHGAIGLVTTHDLALADIAKGLGDVAENVHFEDRFENGEIHFDFKMKPGVVHHSNALALMRSVGLEV